MNIHCRSCSFNLLVFRESFLYPFALERSQDFLFGICTELEEMRRYSTSASPLGKNDAFQFDLEGAEDLASRLYYNTED